MSRGFAIALVAAFVLVTAFVAVHHEPWRDEADAWLYARDGDFSQVVNWTRHAGTPALWYVVLGPLARSGAPYESQQWLHLIVIAAAVALLAMRAPFPWPTKLLITFSYFFAYEYAVIVRTYALTVLLAFAAAALFARSRERPIAFAVVVALLANCNAQGFVIAATFALLFVLQRRFATRDVAAIALMAIGFVVSYLQVRTPADPARQAVMHVFNRDAFAWCIGNGFLPGLPTWLGAIVGLAVLLAVSLALRHSPQGLLMLWLPIAALGILHSWVWLGGLRHAGFFLVVPLLALWIGAPSRARVAMLLLNATLAISCIVAARFAVADVREDFSGANEMASFIAAHRLERFDIAAHNLTQCEALLPYLPRTRFWYAGLGAYGTYLKWDAAQERALDTSYPVAEARAREHFRGRPWLLLFNVEMPDPRSHGFRLLYTNRAPIFEKTDERYWLYAPLP
jgi:hypothetical protein